MHVHFAYVAWLEISVTGVVQEQLADRVYIYIFNMYTYVYISMDISDNKKEVSVNLKKTAVYIGFLKIYIGDMHTYRHSRTCSYLYDGA